MVWIDVFCAVNFILDLLCLRLAGRLTECRRPRCALGALCGTAYSALWFLDFMGWLFILPCRLIFGALVCLAAFGRERLALRTLVYISVSAAFAGIFTALSPALPAFSLVLLALGAYGLVRLALSVPLKSAANRAQSERSVVEWRGRRAEFPVFRDTGCSLRDPVSGRGAMIVSVRELAELLPAELTLELLSGGDAATAIERSGGAMRPVFFTSADGREEMLPAFLPDRITLGAKDVTGALVAVTGGLGENGICAIAGNI